jgi:hypothetical protein
MPTRRASTTPTVQRSMSATKRKTLATQGPVSTITGTDETAAVPAALEADRGPIPVPINPRSLDQPIPNVYRLDPYDVLHEFGRGRLRTVLKGASQKLLRTAVDEVQTREPNTRRVSRTLKADMIDFIVEQVAGPGY